MESNITLTNSSVLTSQEHHEFNLHLHSVSAEQWIIFGIAMPTFVGLSLVFNGLIFLVLLKDKIESSLHLLLHCLSCYDIGVALFSFWIYSWPTICLQFNIFQNYLTEIHPLLVPYLFPIWHMTITGSDYLNLATGVERYLATDRNFREDKKIKHHLGCSTNSTKFYIGKILLLTILFNVPAFFELVTLPNNENQLEVYATSLRSHEVYTQMYRLMAEFLIFKVTPWFAFYILWLSLSRRIRYYTTKRAVKRTMTLNQFSEMRDTRIVLGIIGLFYITNVLTFYNSFAHIMHFHVPPIIPLLASLSLVLNSTFKFLIYVIFSSRFRKGVKKL
eukprot:00441.XXX_1807_87_1 [CDS] Oithona nana genome sequencing.